MTTAPGGAGVDGNLSLRAPNALRGGLARIDARARRLVDLVPFYYNPDSVTRTLQPRGLTAEPGDRLEATRLTGPPHETIKLDIELDAADQLEFPDQSATVAAHGLLPTLASLEQLITPTASSIAAVEALFDRGEMEIVPQEVPMVVLIWSPDRIVPVTVTNMTITEEAFDRSLHPIRVKTSVELKVLSSNDLPADHLGAAMFIAYRQGLERLAALARHTDVRPLGLSRLP